MVNSNTSVDKRGRSSVQPSEQAVVAHSIRIGEQSFNKDDALEVALMLLKHMSHQMLSPDAMSLAFMGAKREMPEHTELIIALHGRACQIRKGNKLSGMF